MEEFVANYNQKGAQSALEWWDDDFSKEAGFTFAKHYHNNTGRDF